MVRLDTCIESMGGFQDSNMTDTNISIIKNHTYRLINVLHRANDEILKFFALLGLKFGMVRLDAHIDDVGGFFRLKHD